MFVKFVGSLTSLTIVIKMKKVNLIKVLQVIKYIVAWLLGFLTDSVI